MLPVSYRLAPHRPRPTLKAWRELFGFSKWLLVGNLCHVVDGQIMTVVLGRFVGMTAVGLYNVAFQIAALPITELAVPIRMPSYAGLSRVRDNAAELQRQVIGALALQALLIAPLSIGIALTANEVTLIFLGERWRELVPLMWIIALFALCDALGGYTHQLLIVLGRQGLYLLIYAAITVARAAAVIAGGWHGGLMGAAYGMLAVSVVNVVVWIAVTARLIGLGPKALVEAFARSAAGALVMSAAVLAMPADTAAALGLTTWPVTTTLLLKAAAGATVYCGVVLVLWKAARMPHDSAEAHVLRTLREGAARLRRRIA
jgi:O-antigen/teichoic acid export membrane protein